jgi:ferredoxin
MSVRFYRKGILVSEVECFQSLNLLAHAQMEEVETGSECGGHGRCGKDRIWIPEEDRKKLNAPTFPETKLLSTEMIDSGWRLACQTFPALDGMQITVKFDAD